MAHLWRGPLKKWGGYRLIDGFHQQPLRCPRVTAQAATTHTQAAAGSRRGVSSRVYLYLQRRPQRARRTPRPTRTERIAHRPQHRGTRNAQRFCSIGPILTQSSQTSQHGLKSELTKQQMSGLPSIIHVHATHPSFYLSSYF
jgi:hypothetical protein